MKMILKGTYGSGYTPCTVFAVQDPNGCNWYVCEDSVNINATYDDLADGVDVEMLQDVDCITSQEPIQSIEELQEHVDNWLEDN